MPSDTTFRRAWKVTFARGAAALALAALVAGLMTVATLDWDRATVRDFLEQLLFLIFVPVVWLLPVGGILDHRWAGRGFGATTAAHVVGGLLAIPVALLLMVAIAAATSSEIGFALPFLLAVVIPVWMFLGSLAAWLVPGSFPRRDESSPNASPGA